MMADYHQDTTKYPPGWDCKFDQNTGKCYYINYITKAMSLEDPRIRYRQLQNERASTESIPMQPMHGSPYHVYPTNNYPAIQAFQGSSNTAVYNVTASPLMASNLQHIEMSPLLRQGSPHTPRIMSQLAKQQIQSQQILQQQQQQQQETSFITPAETDAAVAKINTMFPTASDTHIRLLLKKYYNREAVVISALQVEKHPLTTPGPFSTPPPPRHNIAMGMQSALMQMTPPMTRFETASSLGGGGGGTMSTRTNSPIPRPSSVASGSYGSPRVGEGYRCSPKPHSSPKMKLRYLKSIFPKAEETLLLDILANADNNVQIASEKLISMGYEKRDTITAPRLSNRRKEEQHARERFALENTPPPQPKLKTSDEKNKIKSQLQSRYKDVPGRIITMALESVDYSEDKACQILKIVMQDDQSMNANGSKTEKLEIHGDASVDNNAAAPKKAQSRSDSVASSSATPLTQQLQQHNDSQSTLLVQGDDTGDGRSGANVSTITTKLTTTSSSMLQPISSISPSPSSTSSSNDSSPNTLCPPIGKSKRNRAKAKFDHSKSSQEDTETDTAASTTAAVTPIVENQSKKQSDFKSIFDRIHIGGANSELYKGPNENLLLADYIAWNGANPDLCAGQKGLAHGPDSSLRLGRTATALGANADLYKGPNRSLAKGSIYAQMNRSPMATNVKCN